MKNQQKMQQMYLELQLLTAQIREQEKQLQMLESQLMEIAVSKQSVEEFSKAKTGKEILFPVSTGVFAKGELKDNKELLVNIGSNTIVKKTVEETKKIIDKQFVEIQKVQRQILESITKLSQKALSKFTALHSSMRTEKLL